MTANELLLCCAITKADLGKGDRPTSHQRRQAALAVVAEWIDMTGDTLFPFTIDDIERLSIHLRKTADARTKVDIALAHGTECYFKLRGKGPCSDEVEAAHVLQRCNGGPLTVANGQIECRAHNNQRREMSIEDYMKSDLVTKPSSQSHSACAKDATDGTHP